MKARLSEPNSDGFERHTRSSNERDAVRGADTHEMSLKNRNVDEGVDGDLHEKEYAGIGVTPGTRWQRPSGAMTLDTYGPAHPSPP